VNAAGIRNYFDEGTPYLADASIDPARTFAEVDAIESVLGGPITGRVLDVGCGFGRHSIEISSRAGDVTGIDRSPAMIAAARAAAATANQFADFICLAAEDLREVGRYDSALCLMALGQLDSATSHDAPHLELLSRTRNALHPGASLVIEVLDKDRAVGALVEDQHVGEIHVTRHFNTRTSILTERHVIDANTVYVDRCRLFTTTELVDLIHDAGLEVRTIIEHGLAGSPSATTLVSYRGR